MLEKLQGYLPNTTFNLLIFISVFLKSTSRVSLSWYRLRRPDRVSPVISTTGYFLKIPQQYGPHEEMSWCCLLRFGKPILRWGEIISGRSFELRTLILQVLENKNF